MNVDFYPRFIEEGLREALSDSPVVLIHGPRQCGKTTLARHVGGTAGYTYLTFDDPVALGAAISDPTGFVSDLPEHTIIDEVQRAPALFSALKLTVDKHRTPGRFLLTGSANVLLLPRLSDSLAGRLEIVRLHPLAEAELIRSKPRFLETLFEGGFKSRVGARLGKKLVERIVAGGYPAALARSTARRRAAWYRDYIETLVQRDVRELARITSLDVLPRLLAFGASQTAQLLNVAALAAPFQVSRPTIRDYLTLLERVFLVDTLPPWHSNRSSRLVKTPKLHVGDTGVACALLGVDATGLARDRALLGRLLETYIVQELQRHASWMDETQRFFHFRNRDDAEVDIVIERGSHAIAGIEVKASSTVTAKDFRGLRKLHQAAGKRFCCGVVLYDGETTASFGDRLYAVPISRLWDAE